MPDIGFYLSIPVVAVFSGILGMVSMSHFVAHPTERTQGCIAGMISLALLLGVFLAISEILHAPRVAWLLVVGVALVLAGQGIWLSCFIHAPWAVKIRFPRSRYG